MKSNKRQVPTDQQVTHPWFASYDPGVPHEIEIPQIPAFQLLQQAARQWPRRTCTVFKASRITYRKMDRLTDQLAAALARLGVKKGDRVGIFMPNSPQFVMAYFAILKAGAVVVAINPLYSPQEIEHQLNDAGVKLMFVTSNFYQTISAVRNKTHLSTVIVSDILNQVHPLLGTLAKVKSESERFKLEISRHGGILPKVAFSYQPPADPIELSWRDHRLEDLLAAYQPYQRPQVDISPEDPALFQYSGGTTGLPKAAVALHRNLVANALQIRSWYVSAQPGHERFLLAIPLFHVYGMVAGMLTGIALGAELLLIPNPRDLNDLLSTVDIYGPTFFPGVPTMFNAIIHHPSVQSKQVNLSTIKACISGSAPLLRETKERFENLTGGVVFEGYGLSEAPTATHCNPMMGENRPGSIGLPLPGVEARIISLEDETTPMPPGEQGEIVLRGPQVMKGYHNMPTETENMLRAGWLYTGDIAYMDADGYFYIVDRKKELIKPGGYQVWPREVEEVIITHPKVIEVGVAGVPDPYRGETVKAWVVIQPGQSVTAEEIQDWCRQRLAKYKVPTLVEFRTELPKTQMVGKLLRRELVRQHLDAVKEQAALN